MLQISISMARHNPGEGPAFQGIEEDKLSLEEAIERQKGTSEDERKNGWANAVWQRVRCGP